MGAPKTASQRGSQVASPGKSTAGRSATAKSTGTKDDVASSESSDHPTTYDTLKSTVESFVPVFSGLTVEQQDRRQLDETRVKDVKVLADALLVRVEKEEVARLEADVSLEKIYQNSIVSMYKQIREPMREDFKGVQQEIDAANDRLTVAMTKLKQNVEASEVELASLKDEIVRGIDVVHLLIEEESKQRDVEDASLAVKYDPDFVQLRKVTAVEKTEREVDLLATRKRCVPLERIGEQMNRVAMQQISSEIQEIENSIAKNHADKLAHWNVVAHTITEYCGALSRSLSIVNRSDWDPSPPPSVRDADPSSEP